MKVVGRSPASKSGRGGRFSASIAASILAHGAALALAALFAPPGLDPEAGRPALVVSLAERKNLGSVSASGLAASKSRVSKTAPRAAEGAAADSPDPAQVGAPEASQASAAVAPPAAAERAAAMEAAPAMEVDTSTAPIERSGSQALDTGRIVDEGHSGGAAGTARAGWSLAASAGADSLGALSPESAAEAASAEFRRAFVERLAYPESARRAGRTGEVGLLVSIDGEGRVAWARVRSSSGSSALDRAALDAATSIDSVTPPLSPLSLTIRAVFKPATP